MTEKTQNNFSNQNQVEQTAGLKVLLLRSRVFDLHLFWPLLSLHHALQVLLHSHPRQGQALVLMSEPTGSSACSHLQPGVYEVFQLPAHPPVLVQFPHLQKVRAAPDRRSLWCRNARPRLQGQTPAHVGAEGWSQSLHLQRGDGSQCLSTSPGQRSTVTHRGPTDLCSREVLPATVPQVGWGDVWALFPEQPLSPSALVTRFLDGDGDLA